jgi:hypothetical protein
MLDKNRGFTRICIIILYYLGLTPKSYELIFAFSVERWTGFGEMPSPGVEDPVQDSTELARIDGRT